MRLIVGLGNPGKKYSFTRHNAGFLAIDKIIEKKGLSWSMNKKLEAFLCKDGGTIYIKPTTFMNNSGAAVSRTLNFFKLQNKKFGIFKNKNDNLIDTLFVMHDDLDINFKQYKISRGAGSAGHKGVQSIIDNIKTKEFTRIRIGIKPIEKSNIPTDKLVLMNFGNKELKELDSTIEIILNDFSI